MLEDRARAEVDLGVDEHARDEAKIKKGQPSPFPIEVSVQPGLAHTDPIYQLRASQSNPMNMGCSAG